MAKLIAVNAFFATILLVFIVMPVTSNWLWLGFIFSWCWSEGVVAKDAAVKWWHMLLVFVVLGAIEIYLISVLR